ncbi:hypothetical protein RYX36_006898 [Vicia faba]
MEVKKWVLEIHILKIRVSFLLEDNWNMEFKDAASTAQAAAESDDRATMAAKAVVEFSNMEFMQQSQA